MSLKDLIAADVSRVILNTQDFAGTVVRWAEGTEAAAENVTAVFIPEETSRDTNRGEEIVIPAALVLSADQEVHREDVWIVDERAYQTIAIDDPLHGARTIQLKRTDRKHTRQHLSGGLL